MQLELALSDLTTVLREIGNLRNLEQKFVSACGQFPAGIINESPDIVILDDIAQTQQLEDHINILPANENAGSRLNNSDSQVDAENTFGDNQVQIDDPDSGADNIDIINILESDFDPDQALKRINELRGILEESISQVQLLAEQAEQ